MSTQHTAACDCGWTGGPYRSPAQADYALRLHSCEAQRRKDEAAARNKARLARIAKIDRTPKPCRCKRANHQHGTYAAYVCDGCRCHPCADASSTYERNRVRRNAYGRANLIDADPVRKHVRALMAAGIGLKTISRHTGINGGVMSKLMYGVRDIGRPPSRRITRANAAKLLALNPDDQDLIASGSKVDSTGTRRRLQALVHQGWSINRLADRAGLDRQRLDGALAGRDVIADTARSVTALYNELWDQAPPPGVGTTRALRYATQRGWVGPLAWDDDTIDDPAATPDTGEHTPGMGPRQRVRLEDVEWLLGQVDYTRDGIADRLGTTWKTIERALHRHNRTDLLERLNINTHGQPIAPGTTTTRRTPAA